MTDEWDSEEYDLWYVRDTKGPTPYGLFRDRPIIRAGVWKPIRLSICWSSEPIGGLKLDRGEKAPVKLVRLDR